MNFHFFRKHHDIDMLHGSLPKGILAYAIPLALTGILQQFFNAADVAVVGQFVGKEAMAAVGAAGPIVSLLVNFFTGNSLGTSIVIAQMTGAGDRSGVKKAVHTSVLFSFLGGLMITLIGEIAAVPTLRALSVPDEVFSMALVYLRIYFASVPATALCSFIASILRSHGDSRTPMIALTAAGGLNVLLNVVFVRVCGMTVEGVAWATLASNAICALWLIFFLMRHDGEIKLDVRSLRIDFGVLRRILYIGVPSGVQSMVFQFANLYLQSAINSLGTVAMAACAAARNIEGMIYEILQSFGYACATFVGQNHGAGNDRRCRETIKKCLALDYLVTAAICGVIFVFRYQIMGLFNPDPDVIGHSCIRLTFLFVSYFFSVAYEICSGYLRGYGRPLAPTVISLVFICGIRLLWVAFVFPAHGDFTSLMTVFPVSIGATSVIVFVWTVVFDVRRKKAAAA